MTKENMLTKKRKLRENLNIGQKVLILAKRIKKSQLLANFINKQFKISLTLTKKMTFAIRNEQKIHKNMHCWVKHSKNNKYLLKRFQRHELFAVVSNFIM